MTMHGVRHMLETLALSSVAAVALAAGLQATTHPASAEDAFLEDAPSVAIETDLSDAIPEIAVGAGDPVADGASDSDGQAIQDDGENAVEGDDRTAEGGQTGDLADAAADVGQEDGSCADPYPDAPMGPDRSGALETGMPMSDGYSCEPMEVLLDAVETAQYAGCDVQIIDVDAEAGSVVYSPL
jgi:hypothetical protein